MNSKILISALLITLPLTLTACSKKPVDDTTTDAPAAANPSTSPNHSTMGDTTNNTGMATPADPMPTTDTTGTAPMSDMPAGTTGTGMSNSATPNTGTAADTNMSTNNTGMTGTTGATTGTATGSSTTSR